MSRASTEPELAPRLLRWLAAPRRVRQTLDDEAWSSFRDTVRERWGLDLERHGRLTVAQRLGSRQGGLNEVWRVFASDPESYPGLPELLARADPAERDPTDDESSWPLRNRRYEDELRRALLALDGSSRGEVVTALRRLEADHGRRRDWVWARLGQSPLAQALPHLLRAAEAAEQALDVAASAEDRDAVQAALRVA